MFLGYAVASALALAYLFVSREVVWSGWNITDPLPRLVQAFLPETHSLTVEDAWRKLSEGEFGRGAAEQEGSSEDDRLLSGVSQ